MERNSRWPTIDYAEFQKTQELLHMLTQIVGKYRLAHTPWINHSWHATFYLNHFGFTSSLFDVNGTSVEMVFDFVNHEFIIVTTESEKAVIPFKDSSVADFYKLFVAKLEALNLPLDFHNSPNEVQNPVKFAEQTEVLPYKKDLVINYFHAMVKTKAVFEKFRTGFKGKVSPIHYFWGSADLAMTRFSGKPAKKHPGGIPALPDPITEEAYSEELISAGFWSGAGLGYPAYYCYAYPSPKNLDEAISEPEQAFFHKELGEFILPYNDVAKSERPEEMLLSFLASGYTEASKLLDWNNYSLCCDFGEKGYKKQFINK